jgi:putative addiction module CopG family antidote
MQIHFHREQEAFIQEVIASGLFHDPSEVVDAALWLLRDQVALYKVKHAELKQLIAVGIEQADRGQVAPLDIEAIMAKAASRLQQEQAREADECPG